MKEVCKYCGREEYMCPTSINKKCYSCVKEEMEAASDALIKYICENFHPHVKVIVDCGGLQLVEHQFGIKNEKHILD